jgi:hypothetical protein
MINQPVADLRVKSHRDARTHFSEPLGADLIGESAKAEYRDENRPSFPRQGLDEITFATGAMMLAKRFVGLDLYLTRFLARPLMAVPCVAIHRKLSLPVEAFAT